MAHPLFQLLLALLLSLKRTDVASLVCEHCGHSPVPYPLSTSSNCGDPLYKVRCTKDNLWFDTLNGSSYIITSITPKSQLFTIQPKGFNRNGCTTTDIQSGGIWLNDSLPFTITSRNTVLDFNCPSSKIKYTAKNCSSNSLCNTYIKDEADAAARCGSKPCCTYITGGSKTAYQIDIEHNACTAFLSFVNLNTSLPVSKWPKPLVEIQWALPEEPVCTSNSDCRILTNSTCLPATANGGQRRCRCNAGLQWDPVNGICSYKKCQGREHCRHHINRKLLITGLTSTAGAILFAVLLVLLVYTHRQRIKREAYRNLVKQREEMLNANNSGKSAKLFSGKEIVHATHNFAKGNLLGSGGFGEVFKGILNDGTLTAVKRSKLGNTMGMDQVLNEVRILCQVNHRSLVRLLGCCLELEQPVLVYEYIPNGTLFDHLHGRYSNEWGTLTWQRRLIIAQQTAEGIAYLHFSAVPPIFHRDIKSSNILLDEKLDAKVSDFGLSRLVDTKATHISTCAQGTLGYLDPEYYNNFQLTDKSDVYSFGVVLLELLTSKKALDFNREDEEVNLVAYARKKVDEERLMQVIDPALKERANKLELETMKALGLLAMACLEEQRKNRPSMREVADEIEYIFNIFINKTLKT